jgi:hypothetical protein
MGMCARFTDHIGDLFETWQGGILTYAENQLDEIKEAIVKFQEKNDTKAACTVSLVYSSGQVCHAMETLLLIRPDKINSFLLLSLFFTMRLLPREFSTISWRYLRSEEM